LEPGRIQLTGFVAEPLTKTKAEEILKGVKGIKSIDNQIQVSQTARYGYG
jgi:osmotically-inducible protein OsmY